MNFAQQRIPTRQAISIGLVILLHVGLLYVVISGLGFAVVERMPGRIHIDLINPFKVMPPDTPPPPPQLDKVIPTLMPPPPVVDDTAATPNTPTFPPSAHDQVLPTPHPVIVPPRIDAKKDCSHGGEPPYPEASQRLGEEGSVTVLLRIGASGKVQDAQIEESSGHPRLDQATINYLSNSCHFHPGTVDDKPQPTSTQFKYTWRLEE